MLENNNNNSSFDKKKTLLVPVFSIFVFLILVFSAGYAYFTVGANSMNVANHQAVLPKQTSLTCTATPSCAMAPTYASMVQSANSTTAKNSTVCYVACKCEGSYGGQCKYNVTLANVATSGQTPTTYSPSSGASNTVKEYTAQVTSLGTGCTVQNASTTEQMVNGLDGKVIASCTLTIGTNNAAVTGNTAVTFKWYNANINQNNHAGKTYKYKISSVFVSMT